MWKYSSSTRHFLPSASLTQSNQSWWLFQQLKGEFYLVFVKSEWNVLKWWNTVSVNGVWLNWQERHSRCFWFNIKVCLSWNTFLNVVRHLEQQSQHVMWQKQAPLVDMTFCQTLRDVERVAHKDNIAAIVACVMDACWGNLLDHSHSLQSSMQTFNIKPYCLRNQWILMQNGC